MATFTNNVLTASTGTLTKLDLSTGPHDFTYTKGSKQRLYLFNGEASANLTVTLDGQNVGTVDLAGAGDTDLSAGEPITVNNGELVYVDLDDLFAVLAGTGRTNTVDVAITDATTGNSFGWLIAG